MPCSKSISRRHDSLHLAQYKSSVNRVGVHLFQKEIVCCLVGGITNSCSFLHIVPSLKKEIHLELVTDIAMAVVLVASVWVGAGYYQRAERLDRKSDQVNARIKKLEREAVRVDNKRSSVNTQELLLEIDRLEDKVTELSALLEEE